MTEEKALSSEQLIEYLRANTALFAADEELTVSEVSDGNINFVFRVESTSSKKSIIVKQAMPYIRIFGSDWPLTEDRARIEVGCLQEHFKWCPQHTCEVLHFDQDRSLMVLEDLSNMEILRKAFCQGHQPDFIGRQLGEYLAQSLFHTSDFYLASAEKKSFVARFQNPELCLISEELFFEDPYMDHERNNFREENRTLVEVLWTDAKLKTQVARLKYKFLNEAQALIHGDVHSGSVFVDQSNSKVIDAEFAYFGPMAFDVGSIIGNFLLHFAGRIGLSSEADEGRASQQYLIDQSIILCDTFTQRFQSLVKEKTQDVALKQPGFADEFLQTVLLDSIGFAGTELIRRSIGLAHVEDIDSIADEHVMIKAQSHAVKMGRELILESAATQTDPKACLNRLMEFAWERE